MRNALISIFCVTALVVGVGCAADAESPQPLTNADEREPTPGDESEREAATYDPSVDESRIDSQGCYLKYTLCYANGSTLRTNVYQCCTPQSSGGYYCYTYQTYWRASSKCYKG